MKTTGKGHFPPDTPLFRKPRLWRCARNLRVAHLTRDNLVRLTIHRKLIALHRKGVGPGVGWSTAANPGNEPKASRLNPRTAVGQTRWRFNDIATVLRKQSMKCASRVLDPTIARMRSTNSQTQGSIPRYRDYLRMRSRSTIVVDMSARNHAEQLRRRRALRKLGKPARQLHSTIDWRCHQADFAAARSDGMGPVE